MYKVTIEEVVGEVKKVTTLETDDVELVKTLLEMGQVSSVDSDAPNRNVDKSWQELVDWYQKQLKDKSGHNEVKPYEIKPFTVEGLPYPNQRFPGTVWPSQLTTPFAPTQFPGYSHFIVTC